MHSLVSLMATAGYRSHNSQKTLHTIDSRYIMVIHDNDSAHSTTIMMIKLWSDLHSRMTPFTLPLQASYEVPSMSYTRKNDRNISRAHCILALWMSWFSSTLPGQNGRLFTDDIFWCIFSNEKFCILIKISLKFVPKGSIDNNLVLG